MLSRVVTTGELARNTGRIPADGLCGYLALQWAAAGADYAPEWAELRVVENRERLCHLLSRLLVGCRSERVRLKWERVMVSLRYAPVPWCLSSAEWLDIGDLAHLAIDFSLVVWGRDMGGGHRRVRYPLSGNTPLSRVEGGRLSVSEGQIVLDSEHFFPLDGVPRCEGADSVMELACGGVRRLKEVRGRAEGCTQVGVMDRPVGGLRSGAAED